jgi:calcineurin-like phosphoesterase family protein
MAKVFFTSDWHAGEPQLPNTHSFLRPYPTEVMLERWLQQSRELITSEDDLLVFVGDLAVQLEYLSFYLRLPKCRKVLVMGDKEYANKNFTREQFVEKINELNIFDTVCPDFEIEVAGVTYFVSHKPEDCLKQDKPAICGHIHGSWRTMQMPNGEPIINVGIDVWGGLVSEAFIEHQYNAITKYYDINAKPYNWKTLKYPECSNCGQENSMIEHFPSGK